MSPGKQPAGSRARALGKGGRASVLVALLAGWVLPGCGVAPSDAPTDGRPARTVPADIAARVSAQTRAPAFDAEFERLYREGWDDAASAWRPGTRLRQSAAIRGEVVQAFLRDYRPLEQATSEGLRAMLEDGSAFRETGAAMDALGLDRGDLVDVLALHHAVHWAVVNRDRVRPEQLPAIRQTVASSSVRAGA